MKSNQGKIDDEIFLIIIKYVDLKDVILKFMRLSWSIRNLIKSDNYTLYKKFLKMFCQFTPGSQTVIKKLLNFRRKWSVSKEIKSVKRNYCNKRTSHSHGNRN